MFRISLICLTLLTLTPAAWAVNCGDTITKSKYILLADLICPAPGPAVTVRGPGKLNLNGFEIMVVGNREGWQWSYRRGARWTRGSTRKRPRDPYRSRDYAAQVVVAGVGGPSPRDGITTDIMAGALGILVQSDRNQILEQPMPWGILGCRSAVRPMSSVTT